MNARPLALILLALMLAAVPVTMAVAPLTVYETGPQSPQNMDYDKVNKTFPAHAGWLGDRLVHFYKFRVYSPETYPGAVQADPPPRIPIAPMVLPTDDGTLNGSRSYRPVLKYHTSQGEHYSDFVEVHLVNVSFTDRAPRSWEDVEALRADPVATGIVVNMPLVPTGSKLEDPLTGGVAPIKPVTAWWNGSQVQTFAFETSSQALADLWNPTTRAGNASRAGSGYEMTVAQLNVSGTVPAIPILHVRQYSDGVTPGAHPRGPSPTGMRNVIGVGRSEPGYSPLGQILWVSQLPPDYKQDEASHVDQFTEANGFRVSPLPMYVNCPIVGPAGANNTAKKTTFVAAPVLNATDDVTLQGALVMLGGQNMTARTGSATLANATTSMMGAFVFHVNASSLAQGENTIEAVDANGTMRARWVVSNVTAPPPVATPTPPATPTPLPTPPTPLPTPSPSPAESVGVPMPVSLVILAALCGALLARRRGR